MMAVVRRRIGAGLRQVEELRCARVSVTNTLIAGLMLIAPSLIAQLGSVACLIGVVFTAAYAFAMQAWIIRSFELGATAPHRTATTSSGQHRATEAMSDPPPPPPPPPPPGGC